MENAETVVVETTETTTPEVTPEVTTPDEGAEESVEELKARLAKSEELATNYKVRAEKAEKKAKETPVVEPKPENGLSIKDWKALQDVHDDDVEEVVEWAKFKKITVAEAKKSPHIVTLLKEKQEQRKTAAATNTGPARRGSVKVSDEEVVEKAQKGQLPEDPEALAKARWNLIKGKK